MSIGQRICELRTKKNISQNQLAKDLSISRQAVSKWENDQSEPDTLNLIRLAELLETDVEYLATGRIKKQAPSPSIITVPRIVEKEVEKIVEVEKIIEVEKIVQVDKIQEVIVEKPVIKKVIRNRYIRSPIEYILVGIGGLLLGLLIGVLI